MNVTIVLVVVALNEAEKIKKVMTKRVCWKFAM